MKCSLLETLIVFILSGEQVLLLALCKGSPWMQVREAYSVPGLSHLAEVIRSPVEIISTVNKRGLRGNLFQIT